MSDEEEEVSLTGGDTGSIHLSTVNTKPPTFDDEDECLEVFPDMAEFITDDDVSHVLSPYDIISRTLHQLARDGDSSVLALAISRLGEQGRGRINQLDSSQLAPLHYAARYSHPAAITTLLQGGALVNIRGQDDLTPLHCAARYRKSLKSSRGRRKSQAPEKSEAEESHAEDGGEADGLLPDSQLTVRSASSTDGGQFGRPPQDSVVRLLVENGADVNAVDVYDLTPLHYACMRGNDVAIRDLLSYPQVNIEATDKQMMTPLLLAATFGYTEAVTQLLISGADICVRDEEYQTPLHKAAAEGHLEIVSLLLRVCHKRGDEEKLKALLTARNHERMTALFQAVANGHYQTSRRLLEEGADPNATRDTLATPLHAAASAGSQELIELLVEHGARVYSVDCHQQTPLHKAAAANMPGVVRALLRHGANLERRDRHSFTPLLLAVSEGHLAATEALLEAGADVKVVDKDEKTVIFWSAAEGNEDTLALLLKNPQCRELIDTSDRYDNSPLHAAARRGFRRTVAALLDAGSKIDNKNEDEETALHIAAEEGRHKVVQELVGRYRYLINDQNEDSDTPLHLASLKGHEAVVRALLEAGADVEARNTSLWTPLDCASSAGRTDCCLLLIEYGSPLDPLDKRRTTPLQLAARGGHVEAVQTLLQKGASLSACDATGRNALELAIAAGRKEVVLTMLRSSQWQAALRHARISSKGRRVTPFRMLVRRFPEAAEYVMDRCTSANGVDAENINFGIKFNFEFLDDSYQLPHHTDRTLGGGASYVPQSPYDEGGELMSEAQLFTLDMRELKNNHPLMLMVKHRRPNLLGHPVAVALVKHKWMSSGRYLYYFNLLFYLVFLTFVTGYVLNAPDWATVQSQLGGNSSLSCEEAEVKLGLEPHGFVTSGKWVVLCMAALNIVRELFQLYQARLNYFGLENMLEWVCYICSVVLVWDTSGCVIRTAVQWQVGTAAIFLAWLNLLLFIRKFPFFGIFVVMFTDVFATFCKFFIVFFFFVVAFALSFYTVLKSNLAFRTPGASLLKTSVMMIGEFEYDEIFNDPDNPVPYPDVTIPLFIAFLVLMSIIIMNLLVGLAVDDIKAVQEQAVLKRLGMQTQLVLDVETILPDFLRRLSSCPHKIVHPNARHTPFSRLFGDFKILRSFRFLSAHEEGLWTDRRFTERLLSDEHSARQMSEVERLTQSLADVSTQVEELKSQTKRTHALLTSLVSFLHHTRQEDDADHDGDDPGFIKLMKRPKVP